MKKKINQKVKRRATLLTFMLFCCVLTFFCLLIYQVSSIHKLETEKNELNTQLKQLEDNELNLKSEITKLKDPEYIAQYAREKYYYTKNGEYVLKINKEKKNEKKESNFDNKLIYIFAIGLLLILLIFYFLLKGINRKQKK